jgi:peptidyl-prolyl cis-trans isomerase C
MRALVHATVAVILTGNCILAASGQATQPTTRAATTRPAADAVAVVVNGHQIMERDISEAFARIVEAQTGGRPIPAQQLAAIRERLRPEIVDALIADWLLEKAAEESHITVTERELVEEMNERLRDHLLRSGMSRAELEEQVRTRTTMSLDDFISQRAVDPGFKRSVLQVRLLKEKYPDDFRFSEEAVKARYERDRESVYAKPEQVKASHILISADSSASEEEKRAARKQAESVLVDARKPEADFAQLAQAHSSCPSKARGGDLGYFPREGAMVEPFAEAAFALEPGQVSGIVETRFGYHIIKLTDRKPATTVTLEQAEETIRDELAAEKANELRERYVDELREGAKIEYPGGSPPAP